MLSVGRDPRSAIFEVQKSLCGPGEPGKLLEQGLCVLSRRCVVCSLIRVYLVYD